MILNFEGAGAQARVQVNFSEGSKWLMLGYAKLEAYLKLPDRAFLLEQRPARDRDRCG